MKEERLKKEKQDMLGFYDYTVVLTYISLAVSVFGMTRALEGDFKVAILCLALSGLCDMFDGKIARTKKNRTEDEKKFGIQIDSLCDVVCFGVFPAMICYCLGMNHIPGVIILCLYCVASVIRLGYFNVMEEKRQNETSELRHYYQGLPITSMAIILPFLYLLRRGCGKNFLLVIHVAVVVVGVLFISDFKVKKTSESNGDPSGCPCGTGAFHDVSSVIKRIFTIYESQLSGACCAPAAAGCIRNPGCRQTISMNSLMQAWLICGCHRELL